MNNSLCTYWRKHFYLAHGLSALGLLMMSSIASAGGVGVTAGTLGVGLQNTQTLHRKLDARFSINTFSTSLNSTEQGVDYTADVTLQTFSALLDWHPGGGTFHLSGGLVINNSNAALESDDTGNTSYGVGDKNYTSNDLKIRGDVNFQPLAPYFGMGWRSAPSKQSGFGFSFELGVMYTGRANVDLSASGTAIEVGGGASFDVANDPNFQESLSREESKLEDEIKDFTYYPVVALGVTYAF